MSFDENFNINAGNIEDIGKNIPEVLTPKEGESYTKFQSTNQNQTTSGSNTIILDATELFIKTRMEDQIITSCHIEITMKYRDKTVTEFEVNETEYEYTEYDE